MDPINIFNKQDSVNIWQSVGKGIDSIQLFHEKIQEANAKPTFNEQQKSLKEVNARVLEAQVFIESLQDETPDIEVRIKELMDEIPTLKEKLRKIDYNFVTRFLVSSVFEIPNKEATERLRDEIKGKEEELLAFQAFKDGTSQKWIDNALNETKVCLDAVDKNVEAFLSKMESSALYKELTTEEKIKVILKSPIGAVDHILAIENLCIELVSKLPESDRSKGIAQLSQLTEPFLSKLLKEQNFGILPTLIKFPKTSDFSKSFVREHPQEMELLDSMKVSDYEFINTLAKLPEGESLEDFLEEVIETGLFKQNWSPLLLPKEERRSLLDIASKTAELKKGSILEEINTLASLSPDERENYGDYFQNSFKIDPSLNPTVVLGMRQIPMHERAAIAESFPGLDAMKKIAKDTNPVFLFYLIGENVKDAQALAYDKFQHIDDLPEETAKALIQYVKGMGLDKNNYLLEYAIDYDNMLKGDFNPYNLAKSYSGQNQLIDEKMTYSDKVKIFYGLNALNAPENGKVIPFLAKVPSHNRAKAVSVMPKCEGIEKQLLAEKPEVGVGIIQKLAVLSPKEQNWIVQDYALVKALTAFPQDQMMEVLNFIMKFPLDQKTAVPLLERLIKVPAQERTQILGQAKEAALAIKFNIPENVALQDVLDELDLLGKFSLEERLDYVDACKYSYGVIGAQDLKLTTDQNSILEGFLKIPKDRRQYVFDKFPSYLALKGLAEEQNPVFVFYLLPGYVLEGTYSQLNQGDLKELLTKRCYNILINMGDYPEATVIGALDVLDKTDITNQDTLDYIGYVRSTLEGETSPYKVVKKLENLLKEPSTFQPAPTRIENQNIAYDMKKLKAISEATVTNREDLPKQATLEAFNELFHSFTEIQNNNPNLFYEKIGELLSPENKIEEGTAIWTAINTAVTKDAQEILRKLLKETGVVKEVEGKWRVILNHILNEVNEPLEGHFFTPRQESFLNIMSGIVSCDTGKEQGIHAAYAFLKPEERGKVRFSTGLKDIEDIEEEKGREEVLKFLKEKQLTSWEELVNYAKSDTRESAGKLMRILPYDEEFYDSDEDQTIFTLNAAGAWKISEILYKEEVKEQVLPFIYRSIQNFMDNHIQGVSDAVVEELTNTKNVAEPPHQKKYLRNLIGSLVGLSEEIQFDKHSGVINPQLFDLSRDEVLEVFFRHATIRRLVKALTDDINEDIALNQTQELFKAFLPDEKYWDDGKITSSGALQLLLQTVLKKT